MLTHDGYHDAGGVRGAITRTAESVHGRLDPPQQALARNVFVRLTELGEGTDDTRRRSRSPGSRRTPTRPRTSSRCSARSPRRGW